MWESPGIKLIIWQFETWGIVGNTLKYKSYKMKTSDSRHTSRMTANNFGPFWSKLFWIKLGISSNVLYENQLHKNVTEMFNCWTKKIKRNPHFLIELSEISYSKYHWRGLERSRYCHCKSDLYLRQRLLKRLVRCSFSWLPKATRAASP